MGWFKRTRDLSDRFPSERLAHLPIGLTATIESCLSRTGDRNDAARSSKFITGYLLGYPTYVDDISEQFGGSVRKMLFDFSYGPEKGASLFRAAMGHYLLDDEQTKRGWGAGVPDGERYFKALDEGQNATDYTMSLRSMFEIGMVDLTQSTV